MPSAYGIGIFRPSALAHTFWLATKKSNAYCSSKLLSDMTDGNLSKFFEELRLGNPELQEPFDRYLQALATTVINIRMIFDSPIILGGYVGAYSEYFVDRLRQLVVQLDPYESSADYIYPCVYKKAASAVGAALFFVKKFIDTI